MIELKQINKIYQINQHSYHVLKNIDLTIQRGEIFGIIGKSGAGKSTLLRCVNLLEKPTSGQVIVNDTDLTTLSTQQLREHRHKIGVIFQHFNLLKSRTVFENIALPLEIIREPANAIQQRVFALLELIGLADKKNHFPSQLSGGQKQRVAIARALAAKPHVLLSDEATSALDPESTKSTLALLKKINRELGVTILLITHELDVIKQICGRAGVIHAGELIEQDTALNILANPKTIVTKQLVQQALHLHDFSERKQGALIVQLTFLGKDSDAPLISTLAKQFDITINILQAMIEPIQETTVGFTICELNGTASELERALNFIRSTTVKAEVLHHA